MACRTEVLRCCAGSGRVIVFLPSPYQSGEAVSGASSTALVIKAVVVAQALHLPRAFQFVEGTIVLPELLGSFPLLFSRRHGCAATEKSNNGGETNSQTNTPVPGVGYTPEAPPGR